MVRKVQLRVIKNDQVIIWCSPDSLNRLWQRFNLAPVGSYEEDATLRIVIG